MTTMVWKKCSFFITVFFSRSQYVKSMVCIRIFSLKNTVFRRINNRNETSHIILLYYVEPGIYNQVIFKKYHLISVSCVKYGSPVNIWGRR
jgi:hypothetical protein